MEFAVTIQPDPDGYIGRECPTCEKYFKIKNGTGIPDATDCHCPYCNHVGSYNEFWTKQQIEYAQSVALNKISNDLISQMRKMERRPDPRAFISIGITVKGNPVPIAYYSENELELKTICSSCSLEYSIYGSFGFCPDCGLHNSLQILIDNFEIVKKMLVLAKSTEGELFSKLIENCLEDAVSAFDGFGREKCSRVIPNISFQSLWSAKERLKKEAHIDISLALDPKDWKFTQIQFQKRHLLAHRMGIVDEEYVQKTGEEKELVGRRVSISEEDVLGLVDHLRRLSEFIVKEIGES